MLDTLTLENPTPALAAKPVGALLAHFAEALPWLTDRYGLVQTGVDKDSKERYPQIYRNDGSRLTTDIRPNEAMGALCFFEHDGPALFESDDAGRGWWRYQLALVVWANLPKIDPKRGYDFTEELAADVFQRGLLASPLGFDLQPERIEFQSERVFERYRWDPATHQLLLFPFTGFRIPFTVVAPDMMCRPAFAPLV